MANLCDTCGDSEWDLLLKILAAERDTFDRLGQINSSIASGDLTTENSNLTGINGVAPSVGCGVATAGTLRVAQATDCIVPVEGTVTVSSVVPGTGATNLGKAEDSAHVSGDVGVMSLSVANVAQSTFAADGDYIPQAADLAGNQMVVGNLANDAVDAGNPVKVGGVGRTTNPTAVADGDRVNSMFTKSGRQVTVLGAPRELKVRGNITLTTTGETTLIAAGAAGVFHDIESIVVANTSATGVRVDIRDATAGTVQFSFYAPAGQTTGISLAHPLIQSTAANNWTAQLSAAVTDVRIMAQAHKLT